MLGSAVLYLANAPCDESEKTAALALVKGMIKERLSERASESRELKRKFEKLYFTN
jgi:hypothetical protein